MVRVILDDVGFSALGSGNFELAGEGLCVGRDVSGEPYLDLEREAAAMLARE